MRIKIATGGQERIFSVKRWEKSGEGELFELFNPWGYLVACVSPAKQAGLLKIDDYAIESPTCPFKGDTEITHYDLTP